MRTAHSFSLPQLLQVLKSFFQGWKELPRFQGVIWVAVSGGKDSIVLLHGMHALLRSEPSLFPNLVSLRAIHVNHKVRGTAADADAAFVRSECARLEIACEVRELSLSPDEKVSEARLRDLRYAAIESVIGSGDVVLLAHHADDQAETVFLNLLRGTGVRGLRGMSAVRGPFLRPILGLLSAQIHSATQNMNLSWREDETNRDLSFDRNWLRHRIFPELEARRPGFSRRLVDVAADIRAEWSAAIDSDSFSAAIGGLAGVDQGSVSERMPSDTPVLISSGSLLKSSPSNWGERIGRSLLRTHVDALGTLLRKGNGKVHVPGGQVWVSCRWVLSTPDAFDLVSWSNVVVEGGVFHSILGKWECTLGDVAFCSVAKTLRNKRLQRARVPQFFRECVPSVNISDSRGALTPQFLVPKNWGRPQIWNFDDRVQFKFLPSELNKKSS